MVADGEKERMKDWAYKKEEKYVTFECLKKVFFQFYIFLLHIHSILRCFIVHSMAVLSYFCSPGDVSVALDCSFFIF